MAEFRSDVPMAESPGAGQARRSPWGDVLYRLRRRKTAVCGAIVVVLFALVALLAPALAPHDPVALAFGQQYLPPAWVRQSAIGKAGDLRYLLGTDGQGRDLLSRLIYGTQASMCVGLGAALVVVCVGVAVGLAAGYVGGRFDNLMMRVADVFYAFPSILFYIMIVLIFRRTPVGQWQNGLAMLILALTSIGWVGLARLVRGTVLSLKAAEFVEAARCVGASDLRIIVRHVLPNCLGVIIVWMTSAIPRIIMVEAVLGYVGIGLSPATSSSPSFFVTSWGGLFLEGRMAINIHPMIMLAPTVCVALVGMGFNFLGDGLRDVLDPHTRSIV